MKKLVIFFLIFCCSMIFAEDKNLGLQLKGIVFINDYKNFSKKNEDFKGIKFNNYDPPNKKGFINEMKCFLGKDISMELINGIQKKTVLFLRKNGMSVVDVFVLADQDISNGTIQVMVICGKIGDINLVGNKYFNDHQILKNFNSYENNYLDEKTIRNDLFWLNQSPYRKVSIIYEPGEGPGFTNIELNVKETRPLKVYGGYDLNQYQIAGQSRFYFGLNMGNLFKRDHQLNVQLMSADNFNKWSAVSGSYIIPFPWRNELKVYGTYVRSKTDKKYMEIEDDYDLQGRYWQVSCRYKVPLPIIDSFYQNFQMGYDFKRTNNFLSVSEILISSNYVDISQFMLRYEYDFFYSFGSLFFGTSVFWSPGKMTSNNTAEVFNEQRTGAKPDYTYASINLDSLIRACKYIYWAFSSYFQISSGKLMPIEQISVGGVNSVRGYPENEVIGDNGFYFRNEIRSSKFEFFGKKSLVQFLVFLYYGRASDIDQAILAKDTASLMSIGPGLRYSLKENVSIKFDYGFQLKAVHGRYFGEDIRSQPHLSIYMEY